MDVKHPRIDTAESILKVSVMRNLEVIISKSKLILRHILDQEDLVAKLSKMEAAITALGYNSDVIEEQIAIFELLLKRGEYPLND